MSRHSWCLLWLAWAPGLACASADAQTARSEAEQYLLATVASLPCETGHYIYGVGATDGAYVERVFYTADSGSAPRVELRFRDPFPEPAYPGDQISPLRFELQLEVARARHAVPAGQAWVASGEGWDSALRFKYTNWFGTIAWRISGWEIDWQGYRRPLLPAELLDDPRSACSLFEGTNGSLVESEQ